MTVVAESGLRMESLTPIRYAVYRFPLVRMPDGSARYIAGGFVGTAELNGDGKLVSIDAKGQGHAEIPGHFLPLADKRIELLDGHLLLTESGAHTAWEQQEIHLEAGDERVVAANVAHGGNYVGDRIRVKLTFDPPYPVEWVQP